MDRRDIRNRGTMKKIGFVCDFFKEDLAGGGEVNDSNLINHLQSFYDIKKYRSKDVTIEDLQELDSVVVGNFTMMPAQVAEYLSKEKDYFIYEHDHKYVSTRDPSKFKNFEIPQSKVINRSFYESAACVIVLSEICRQVLTAAIPTTMVHSIGCSLWSKESFDLLREHSSNKKRHNICIMKNMNPTKNYVKTVEYCKANNLDYRELEPADHQRFLRAMSKHKNLLFIPTVLETYSRLCAEAKMLNMGVMTNKKLIGFFSEEYSSLQGEQLIDHIESKNEEALKFFKELF